MPASFCGSADPFRQAFIRAAGIPCPGGRPLGSSEPYRGVPAKPTSVPFFITATNKAAAVFFFPGQTEGLSLPGVLLTAVRHTDVLQPLNVHGGASRRVGRAPRVCQARYTFKLFPHLSTDKIHHKIR